MIQWNKILGRVLSVGVLAGLTTGSLVAQNNSDRSPYSRFGYGTLGLRQTAPEPSVG